MMAAGHFANYAFFISIRLARCARGRVLQAYYAHRNDDAINVRVCLRMHQYVRRARPRRVDARTHNVCLSRRATSMNYDEL